MEAISAVFFPPALVPWGYQMLYGALSVLGLITLVTLALKLKEVGFKVMCYTGVFVCLLLALYFFAGAYLMYTPSIGLALVLAVLMLMGNTPTRRRHR